MTTTALTNKVNSIAEIQTTIKEKLQTLFASNNSDEKIHRIKIDIPQIDIISWFQKQPVDKKMFWSDRDDKFAVTGIHFADLIQNGADQQHPELFKKIQTQLHDTDESVRYFGGIKFDTASEVTAPWENFGTATFVLPRFELLKRNETYQFVCNIITPIDKENQEVVLAQLADLNFSDDSISKEKNEILNRTDFPDEDEWMLRVNSVLSAMNAAKYEKIVLARKTELTFKENISADKVMADLLENTSNCFHFCFQLSPTNAFLGATPERLYYRKKTTVKCEAVAGTRTRGDDERHDKSLADELLQSKKDIKEHRYVIDSIIEALSKYVKESNSETAGTDSTDGDVVLVQLARVQHLIKRFKFTLHDSVTDFDLVNRLHPTAAVGGYPKKNILVEIREIEKFDRGFYAAPIGWISKETSEFAVAIRSGLIDENRLTLYSGAGIISDSIPESEWDEIENKIKNFLKILDS